MRTVAGKSRKIPTIESLRALLYCRSGSGAGLQICPVRLNHPCFLRVVLGPNSSCRLRSLSDCLLCSIAHSSLGFPQACSCIFPCPGIPSLTTEVHRIAASGLDTSMRNKPLIHIARPKPTMEDLNILFAFGRVAFMFLSCCYPVCWLTFRPLPMLPWLSLALMIS